MNKFIDELECDTYKVMQMAQTTPSEHYMLIPKSIKTQEDYEKEFPYCDFTGCFPYRGYIGKYLIERTPQDVLNNVSLKELVNNKKLELQKQTDLI